MVPQVYIIKRTDDDGTIALSDAFISRTDAMHHGKAIVLNPPDEGARGFGWVAPDTFPENFPMIPPLNTVWSVVDAFNWFMEQKHSRRRVEMLTLRVLEPGRW